MVTICASYARADWSVAVSISEYINMEFSSHLRCVYIYIYIYIYTANSIKVVTGNSQMYNPSVNSITGLVHFLYS